MKRFYTIFLLGAILFFTLLYFSLWWFLAGIFIVMIFIAYRYFATRLEGLKIHNEALELQIEGLHTQLDHSIIMEKRTAKEVERVKQMKEKLLSVLGHEIRTPMNGIMGTTLLLSDTSLSAEQKGYTETIRACGEGLLTTVNEILANDILDFSKLEQQEKPLEYKEFDLYTCVEEVLDMFASKTFQNRVELLYHIEPDVPAQIIGDRKRLSQLLMNLVENAVKYTSYGEICVDILYSTNPTGNYPELHVAVRDTGAGIPENQVKTLFSGIPGKEFSHDSKDGTKGLGLVICRKLVELMGGEIEVKSQQGKGSTFTFHIPVVPSLKATRSQEPSDIYHSLEGKHILIADDNRALCNTLSELTKSWKMQPVSASSAQEALNILSVGGHIDIILADCCMHGMTGLELTKMVKEKNNIVPVILLNEPGSESYRSEAPVFASILTKPLRQHLLKDAILSALAGDHSKPQGQEDKFSEGFSKQYPLRILVAEDNIVNQKLALKILNKLGYQPALAKNGKEAIEMVSSDPYDVILMDVQMPEMDGLEATRLIRTCLQVQPVIIAMTANAMPGDRDECLQAGMDDYISKPIELNELLGQFEKWHRVITEKRKNRHD